MSEMLEKIRRNNITTKSGVNLAEHLRDMRGKGGGLLILNLGDSRKEFSINPYILEKHKNEVEDGLEILGAFAGAADTKRFDDVNSSVTREMTAVYSIMDDGTIRCNPAKQEYLADSLSYGYRGKPTLIVSAEDCMMISALANDRPVRKITAIIDGEQINCVESDVGSPLQDLLERLDNKQQIKAYHLGNQLGTILSPDEVNNASVELTYIYDTVHVLRQDACMVSEMNRFAKMAAEDSCQRCVLCREGTWQAARMLQDALDAKGKSNDINELQDLAEIAGAGSMCQFGKQVFRPLAKAMKLFPTEFEAHIEKHFCSVGACGGSRGYQIDPLLCSGCTECVNACEYDAIDGKKDFIHMIDEKMCEKCGVCLTKCPEAAIKVGADLKVPERLTKVGRYK